MKKKRTLSRILLLFVTVSAFIISLGCGVPTLGANTGLNIPLAVSSISPSTGNVAGGTGVTITGTGFRSSVTVSFGGVPAASVTYVSSGSLRVITPSRSAGIVNVVLNQSPHHQSAMLQNGFTFTDRLGLSGISPGFSPTAGGTTVIVTGSGFATGAEVSFGGTQSSAVTVVSSTQISAVAPAHTAGTISVTVTNPDSQTATLASAFTYTSALTISGDSPSSGPTIGGTVVQITGTGFMTGATVKFGAIQSTAVTVASSTQINAMSPPENPGAVILTVTNPNSQTATLASAFTYTSAPTISSLSPNSGPVTGGTTVTILGSGFASGAAVSFGGLSSTSVTCMSSSQIRVVVPSSSAGTIAVTVTNPDAQSGTLSSAFTYYHTVTLSWIPSTSNVVGYNVYKSSTSGGPYSLLNTTPVTATAFTQNNVPTGATVFYVATAVSANNVESTYSNEARVTVPSP